uniref:Bulb-type lectin domain-containing protein n=1 Tax=Fagus sylvatica TaxID=28930 RepID=A0A2N9F4K3_FAGSY
MKAFSALIVYSFLFSFLNTSTTLDTITPSQPIRDHHGETLVSAGGSFELGFFSPGSSKNRYVGIWYVISKGTVVWVANRETPLENHSGVLNVTEKGILVLLDTANNTIIWSSSNTSRTAGNNPTAQLLDSGNLVVKDRNIDNPDNILWQSFDYPCDTLLPDMKVGWDFSNWPNSLFNYEFVLNEKEVYYVYKLLNKSIFSRYVLNPSGIGQRFRWMDHTQSWELFSTGQVDECENYAHCGSYASCNIMNSPVCECLKGFKPKSPKAWNSADWSDGCVQGTPLGCNDGDGFLKYEGVKLPDTSSSRFDRNMMSLKECEEWCLKNCSCTAYANLDIRNGGTGCLLWFADLVDIAVLAVGGQDLYIRVSASVLGNFARCQAANGPLATPTLLVAETHGLQVRVFSAIALPFAKKREYSTISQCSRRR